MGFSTLLFSILMLAVGAGVSYFFLNSKHQAQKAMQSSTILLERIEKVFKVVMAEGYFTEIFDYKDDKTVLYMFKNSKKALVIAKAKVLVGFDFGKMKFSLDESSKRMVIEQFPKAEILSIDTDYKFYDVDNGIFNKFNHEDYTNLLTDAKQAMNDKAMSSDLPRIANNQVQMMMYQLAASMNWKVDLSLPESDQKQLETFTAYEPLNAEPKVLKALE